MSKLKKIIDAITPWITIASVVFSICVWFFARGGEVQDTKTKISEIEDLKKKVELLEKDGISTKLTLQSLTSTDVANTKSVEALQREVDILKQNNARMLQGVEEVKIQITAIASDIKWLTREKEKKP